MHAFCSVPLPIILFAAVITGLGDASKHALGSPPNVIVILTDDQGWGDLSLHGNPNLQTPHIDSLARDGAQLTNFYVCPVCSPTRAEFLTGRYHTRMGVYSTSSGGERFHADERTIGDVFADAGYATAAYGKWHSGMQPPYHPNARGFDDFYGFCSGHWGNYFSPMLEHNGAVVQGNGFLVDDLTDHAIDFIRSVTNSPTSDQPFFVYLPLNTPHSPMQVPNDDWNAVAHRNIIPDPSPENAKGEVLSHTRSALALCENIDDNVGRLLRFVDEQGVAANTIIVFFCDNGPNGKRFNGGMKGRKGSVDEGGVRSPCLIRYPDGITGGSTIDDISGAIDLLPTLAELADIDVGEPRGPLDGVSLAHQLTTTDTPGNAVPDRRLFSRWNRRSSVRSPRWRYVNDGSLYDIHADRQQRHDLRETHPDVAQRLAAELNAWMSETQPISKEDAQPLPFTVAHPDFATTQLPARDANATAGITRSNRFPNCTYFRSWTSADDVITWDVHVLSAGEFEVTLVYGCDESSVGTELSLSLCDASGAVTAQTRGSVHEATPPEFLNTELDRSPRQEGFVKQWGSTSLGTMRLSPGRGQLKLTAPDIQGPIGVEVRLITFHRVEKESSLNE